jgi:pantoate--beta-alanine ligase
VTQTVRTVADLRLVVAGWRRKGERVGLVPTMGALHDGHLALVAAARAQCQRVVVSLFVNPTQFAPTDDFTRYPRREAEDLAMLERGGANLLFAPDVAEMYPAGFATEVRLGGPLVTGLDAACRPGHFEGVATIVSKLLLQTLPDAAFFGEKDYQQLQVIRRVAADLDSPARIVGVPTVREPDGLALSSRNAYLSAAERAAASALPAILRRTAAAIEAGQAVADTIAAGEAALREAGFDPIDYLSLCDAATLAPLDHLDGRPARLLVAARIGATRLIDNLAVAGAV